MTLKVAATELSDEDAALIIDKVLKFVLEDSNDGIDMEAAEAFAGEIANIAAGVGIISDDEYEKWIDGV